METQLGKAFSGSGCLGKATRFAEEIHEVIDQAPLFDELSFQEIEALCEFMVCYAAPRHSLLMRESDSGAALGEMSMIDGQARFATCISTEPVDFAVLSRKALNDILLTTPYLGPSVV